MDADFKIGDFVFMPGAPWALDTVGRIFDIRDYGIEVWVETISEPRRNYYTYYDQLAHASILDLLISDGTPQIG